MKIGKFRAMLALFVCTQALHLQASIVVDFEDNSLAADSFHNGGPTTNNDGWQSGGVHFGNSYVYNEDWQTGFWNGFAYSNVNDTTTPGFTNQYAAITGTGVGGGGNYAIAYSGTHSYFNLPSGYTPSSVFVTNTTYSFLTMQEGDSFTDAFTFGDYFKLSFNGYDQADAQGNSTGTVEVYLADFRSGDSSEHFILEEWVHVNLNGLGNAASVRLNWDSSDTTDGWINTPTYVAIDNLEIIPEPGALLLVLAGGALLTLWLRKQRG